ncbi:hypothetical protein RUM43_002907 [Polyplax serrata]|uniref:Aquaporin n=1 Tax=Polyplax serrata TaxID=468196 RepID=A0AAN8S2V9_POLSC
MLVFIGCSGVTPALTPTPPPHLQICIVFGIAVAILVQVKLPCDLTKVKSQKVILTALEWDMGYKKNSIKIIHLKRNIFGHISGCHINPSVTLAAFVYGEVSLTTTAIYIISQYIGATLGYGSLLFLTPKEALYADKSHMNETHGFCTTVPNSQVSAIQALGSEFFATAILIYVCCSFWDKNNAVHHDSAPIKFGMTVTGLATAFGPFSGGSMNPARSFAPALFTGVWDRHWIYWVGPLSAAVLITLFYKFTFERNRHCSKLDHSEISLNHVNSKVQIFEKVSTHEVV